MEIVYIYLYNFRLNISTLLQEEMKVEPASIETVTTSPHSPEMSDDVSPPQMDHDYATLYTLPGGQTATIIKQESGKAWIEQDAPPMVRFKLF